MLSLVAMVRTTMLSPEYKMAHFSNVDSLRPKLTGTVLCQQTATTIVKF